MKALLLLLLPSLLLIACSDNSTDPSNPSDLTAPVFPFLGIGSYGTIQVMHETRFGGSSETARVTAQFLNRDEEPAMADKVLVGSVALAGPIDSNGFPMHEFCCLPLDFDGSPIAFITYDADEVFDINDTVPELTGPTEVLDIRDGDTLDLENLTIRWNGRGADTAVIRVLGDSTRLTVTTADDGEYTFSEQDQAQIGKGKVMLMVFRVNYRRVFVGGWLRYDLLVYSVQWGEVVVG